MPGNELSRAEGYCASTVSRTGGVETGQTFNEWGAALPRRPRLDSARAGRPRIRQPRAGPLLPRGDARRSVVSVHPVPSALPDREEV